MFTGIDFRFNGSRGKIFKLEIGNFFSFSLLSDIDQAHVLMSMPCLLGFY